MSPFINPHYTYLIVDLGALSIPLLFSFHPKLQFYKEWRWYLPAMAIVAMLFLLHDAFYTSIGVWGFTPEYLTGFTIGNLPLEEVLFFVCIPYACVFTYHSLGLFWSERIRTSRAATVANVLSVLLLIVGVVFFDRLYTSVTFITLSVTLFFVWKFSTTTFLGRFFLTYLILLVPFFITNGILTGTGLESQVVWYNPDHFMGVRMGTIPVEDTFYGMLLVLGNVGLYEWFKSRGKGLGR